MMEKRLCETLCETQVQFFLMVSAIITFGFGDGITAMMLIHFNGYAAEYSAILRYFAMNGGLIGMFLFKVITVTLLILVPLFTQKKDGSEVWKINGFLFTFVIGGAVASLDNLSAIINGTPFMDAQSVIAGFVVTLIAFVEIGDIMDHREKHAHKQLGFKSTTTSLNEDQWIQKIHS